MITEFVKAWDKNNNKLLDKYLLKSPSNYKDIVVDLIETVINPYVIANDEISYPLGEGLNVEAMTVIDDGGYQGTTIYIVPINACQPSIYDYYYTNNYYGSCSGCDTFLAIESDMEYDDSCNLIITPDVAKQFHSLALHLLQNFKKLSNESEE